MDRLVRHRVEASETAVHLSSRHPATDFRTKVEGIETTSGNADCVLTNMPNLNINTPWRGRQHDVRTTPAASEKDGANS